MEGKQGTRHQGAGCNIGSQPRASGQGLSPRPSGQSSSLRPGELRSRLRFWSQLAVLAPGLRLVFWVCTLDFSLGCQGQPWRLATARMASGWGVLASPRSRQRPRLAIPGPSVDTVLLGVCKFGTSVQAVRRGSPPRGVAAKVRHQCPRGAAATKRWQRLAEKGVGGGGGGGAYYSDCTVPSLRSF